MDLHISGNRVCASILAATVLCLALGAQADDVESAANAAAKPDRALDPNRRVCRHLPVTGTHFKRRICKTAAQWQAEAEAARNFAQQLERGQDVEQVHINRQGTSL